MAGHRWLSPWVRGQVLRAADVFRRLGARHADPECAGGETS